MTRIFSAVILISVFLSCNSGKDASTHLDTAKIDGHPAWILQGNIYEVNVRQYTAEGTFKAFAKSLERLKEMGVQTLWFMPINPISKVDRKGTLGSYYAISDYTAINPEFGTMDDWKDLVKQAHEMGFKVMIDWVPNHTGADHYWLQKHPDFYVRDSSGKAVSQFDWTDTRKLDFNNRELQDTMIQQMKFWVTETGIDGFRCDYAVGPSRSFWTQCVQTLKATKNLFMLAETDFAWLHSTGFDATYGWPEFNMMKLIASGKRKAFAFDSVVAYTDSTLPANGIRLMFTSNHDENSWNHADYETMPGDVHAPFAVLSQTMKRSVPLVYSSQEEPLLRAIPFFEKDTIPFSKFGRAGMYKELQNLRTKNPALAANASFTKLVTDKDDAIYAYYRQAGNHTVLVVLNLSNQPQKVTLGKETEGIFGKEGNFHQMGSATTLKRIPVSYDLKAWGYVVVGE